MWSAKRSIGEPAANAAYALEPLPASVMNRVFEHCFTDCDRATIGVINNQRDKPRVVNCNNICEPCLIQPLQHECVEVSVHCVSHARSHAISELARIDVRVSPYKSLPFLFIVPSPLSQHAGSAHQYSSFTRGYVIRRALNRIPADSRTVQRVTENDPVLQIGPTTDVAANVQKFRH